MVSPLLLLPSIFALARSLPTKSTSLPPSCDSKIYCQGDLLHQVQTKKLYDDAKHFVDLKLKTTEQTILDKFEELKKHYSGDIPTKELMAFVDEYFIDCQEVELEYFGKKEDEPRCKELMPWNPPDWSENPSFLSKIKDPYYRVWASKLNNLWQTLGRKMDIQVKEDANMTSLIYVPNGFIIPGGRFHEMYYWDTFWVIKGLLVSGMTDTVKGIIENFLSLIQNLGHIPNGSRVYYTQRSQPPLLTHMVEAYVQNTGDKSLIKSSIALLDRELEYFISNRQVDVKKGEKTHKLYRYFAVSEGPRPESYSEDYENAQTLSSEDEKTKFYIAMKSAAESGWDFSSRWFLKKKANQGKLTDTDIQDIIPVDLNAILHKNFKLLAEWYGELGPHSRAEYFSNLQNELLTAMNEVLWNEKDGIWYDYDNLDGMPRKYFYMSNFAPLWTESHSFDLKNLTKKILNYQTKINLRKYIGGSPTSLVPSTQQWDFSNAWPPLQTFILEGLDKLGTFAAQETSYHLANQWIKSNYQGYMKYGKMFEKYNALALGEPGQGGEYADQEGFGWTNGLILDLLNKYGDILTSRNSYEVQGTSSLEKSVETNQLQPEVVELAEV
uniref:Trehalase n=2 Tax=Lygus hesperus TaxID=30085 RepID=A0A0A9WFY1_LYGHE